MQQHPSNSTSVFTEADSTVRRRRASIIVGDATERAFGSHTARAHPVAMPALATECSVGGRILTRVGDTSDRATFIGISAHGNLEASEIARGEFFSYVPGIGCVALWPAIDHTSVEAVNAMAWDHAYILASSLTMGAEQTARYVRDVFEDGQFVIWVVLVADAGGHKKITCKITDHGMFAAPSLFATPCTRVSYITAANMAVAVDNRIVIARHGAGTDTCAVMLYRPFRHDDRVWQRIMIPTVSQWHHYDDLIVGIDLASENVYNVRMLTGLTKGARMRTIQTATRVTDAFLWGEKLYVRTQGALIHVDEGVDRAIGDFLMGGIVLARNGDWFLTKKRTEVDHEYVLVHVLTR